MRVVLFVASMSLVWSVVMGKPNSNTTHSSSSILDALDAMLDLEESTNDGHSIGNLTSARFPQRTTEASVIDDGRIGGGQVSEEGQWNFMAFISVQTSNDTWQCSGYIWNRKTIVTAAHCL